MIIVLFFDMIITFPMGSSWSKLHINMVQKLASKHLKVHKRMVHVKFKVVFAVEDCYSL